MHNGSIQKLREVIRDIYIPDELVFQVVNDTSQRDTIIHLETKRYQLLSSLWMKEFSKITANFLIPQRWYAP